jgi:hypothetical protein
MRVKFYEPGDLTVVHNVNTYLCIEIGLSYTTQFE